VHPPPSPARANFTLITECTPESSGCNSVYSVVYTVECTFRLGRGGGGRRSERRYSRGATVHKYSSFVQEGNSSQVGLKIQTMSECISSLLNLLNRMPQILLTGQLKEKLTYRVWCLYSSFVHGRGDPVIPLRIF
jgi:hypothetical protein